MKALFEPNKSNKEKDVFPENYSAPPKQISFIWDISRGLVLYVQVNSLSHSI